MRLSNLFVIAFVIALIPSLTLCFFQSTAHGAEKATVVEVAVTENGFEPAEINVKAGTPVTLKITRKTDATCAKSVDIPSKKMKKDLPLNKAVTIELGKLTNGELKFACSMDMFTGKIVAK